MKATARLRLVVSLLVMFCMLAMPVAAFAKGEKNFKRGLQYEAAMQWEKAVQEFALAVAANPSNMEYQLHYRRAVFNASQSQMQQGRALAEKGDYVGAYNAYRQAYAYDPVNEFALAEMERMVRLQREKEGNGAAPTSGTTSALPSSERMPVSSRSTVIPTARDTSQDTTVAPRTEQLRIVTFTGDLKAFIRTYAEILGLNVVFDNQLFRQPRSLDISLRDVTAAQALDYVFLQEGLFFQKLGRRTILVAEQTRRPQYQQLVLRTFYLQNIDPLDAQKVIQSAIPAQAGRTATIVIPEKATNSLTIRDTPENVRLIGEILESIDKDRAEVVMDVNIYEVSRSDLLQFGNQIGTEAQLTTLGAIQGGVLHRSATLAFPSAFGVGIALPPSNLIALQRKDRTKLLFATSVHAFNGQESEYRVGQRVPVQTAQTFPFGTAPTAPTPGGVTPGVGFAGGFPVFNYEPTGLTLRFEPQIFPNQDVEVKMTIESKDVINPGSPTPTFTERAIKGKARIQNNRTMLLASVAQDKTSKGRVGLPLLGLIPILGRLFTAPRRDDLQSDIVIAITPRILRAPSVTPRDVEMRASGTLQTPTAGSVEAVIREAEREEQLAAARTVPSSEQIATAGTERAQPQQQTAALPTYVPAPRPVLPETSATASTGSGVVDAVNAAAASNLGPVTLAYPASPGLTKADVKSPPTSSSESSASKADGTPIVQTPARTLELRDTTSNRGKGPFLDDRLTYSPLPLVKEQAPASSANASSTEQPVSSQASMTAAEMRLIPDFQEMSVGENRRLALVLKTDAQIGLAVIAIRFDPRVVAVRDVAAGNIFSYASGIRPRVTHSVDQSGLLLISVAPPPNESPITGAGVLVFLELEGIVAGQTAVAFDETGMHVISSDKRHLLVRSVGGQITIK